ncbi:hypothetical protein A3K64_02720 [Candidatus Micrarchaeota archaeon RBG_16_36_9]|nr:MAG: hypothetical protein A3K64_02720 [Candidatus Micrarchaeota archaeon RBG_16_36_9]
MLKRKDCINPDSNLLSYEDEQETKFIDEKNYKVLEKNEVCHVSHNEGLVCFFGKEQLISAFSEIFRGRPRVIKPYSKDCKDTEMIVFSNKDYTFTVEMLKESRISLKYENEYYKSDPPQFEITVHPIRRNIYFVDNRTFLESKIDVLDILKKDKKALDLCELLNRVENIEQWEWDKLHKGKRIDYLV